MTLLGAVLAGGKSSRFGSDKAEAMLDGRSLLDHAVDLLGAQCDAVVVVGRSPGVADWPAPGMGPLAGVAAALIHAGEQGHDAVLTVPVDCPTLPADLRARLEPGPSFAEGLPVVGLWAAADVAAARAILSGEGRHSMRAFAEQIGARAVAGIGDVPNLNTQADLEELARHG